MSKMEIETVKQGLRQVTSSDARQRAEGEKMIEGKDLAIFLDIAVGEGEEEVRLGAALAVKRGKGKVTGLGRAAVRAKGGNISKVLTAAGIASYARHGMFSSKEIPFFTEVVDCLRWGVENNDLPTIHTSLFSLSVVTDSLRTEPASPAFDGDVRFIYSSLEPLLQSCLQHLPPTPFLASILSDLAVTCPSVLCTSTAGVYLDLLLKTGEAAYLASALEIARVVAGVDDVLLRHINRLLATPDTDRAFVLRLIAITTRAPEKLGPTEVQTSISLAASMSLPTHCDVALFSDHPSEYIRKMCGAGTGRMAALEVLKGILSTVHAEQAKVCILKELTEMVKLAPERYDTFSGCVFLFTNLVKMGCFVEESASFFTKVAKVLDAPLTIAESEGISIGDALLFTASYGVKYARPETHVSIIKVIVRWFDCPNLSLVTCACVALDRFITTSKAPPSPPEVHYVLSTTFAAFRRTYDTSVAQTLARACGKWCGIVQQEANLMVTEMLQTICDIGRRDVHPTAVHYMFEALAAVVRHCPDVLGKVTEALLKLAGTSLSQYAFKIISSFITHTRTALGLQTEHLEACCAVEGFDEVLIALLHCTQDVGTLLPYVTRCLETGDSFSLASHAARYARTMPCVPLPLVVVLFSHLSSSSARARDRMSLFSNIVLYLGGSVMLHDWDITKHLVDEAATSPYISPRNKQLILCRLVCETLGQVSSEDAAVLLRCLNSLVVEENDEEETEEEDEEDEEACHDITLANLCFIQEPAACERPFDDVETYVKALQGKGSWNAQKTVLLEVVQREGLRVAGQVLFG
eukprot:TRINITY_DN24581_c0_g1_i1.p1 TRINITY_DN24581_c0_g1~~TRINITY_DN24581_c0_g1_i1.p1  ORF type:complete len:808 (+),score=165.51 TRINITY_DN24581_c0_g1_i1:92-2515(+)